MGKREENQREQPVIISSQFSRGCGHQWVASSLVSTPLCGLRGKFLLGETAALSCAVMPVGAGERAEKGFFFFLFHSCTDTVSLL